MKQKVVDKAGAGDCTNGVSMNLITNGTEPYAASSTTIRIATMSIDDYGISYFAKPYFFKIKSISLSPRPERLTKKVSPGCSGAIFIARATA